jgi:hypothetical protein
MGLAAADDGTASLKRRDNASLTDTHTLLFHRFMNRRPILFVHLVKLINQADTSICQHQGTSF